MRWVAHRTAICSSHDRNAMDLPDTLQRALRRLDGALDALEAAAERRAEADAARGDAAGEYLVMQDDRARLAAELDAALARGRALDRAAEDVSGRLERAGAEVRAVLAALTSPAGPA